MSNLAVADYDANNLIAAERGFLAERNAVEKQLSLAPNDSAMRGTLAEIFGWLGSVAEKDGRYAEALARYRDMEARLKSLHADESAVAKWRYRLAEAHGHVGRIQSITGHAEEAVKSFQDALRFLEAAPEPSNQQWRSVDLAMQLERTIVQSYIGRVDNSQVTTLRENIEALLARNPRSRPVTRMLAMALQLEARIPGTPADKSLADAQRARRTVDSFTSGHSVDSMIEGELARACLLEGRMEMRGGNPERARECWLAVVTLLESRAAHSRDWRVLDPLAQAFVLVGRKDSAQPLIEILKRSGYRPMDFDAASTLQLNR